MAVPIYSSFICFPKYTARLRLCCAADGQRYESKVLAQKRGVGNKRIGEESVVGE